jgi:hypothetical protein
MKLAKTIIIMILSVLLALSISLNIFILTIFGIKDLQSFKQVLLCKELLDSFTSMSSPEATPDVSTPEADTPEADTPEADASTEEVFYQDEYVIIRKLKQETGLLGPTVVFSVENISTYPILISFKDVYIDGYKADLSGLYCECLDPGMKAIEDFTLWKSDYEDFTSKPKEVRFIIDIMDPHNFVSLVEPTPAKITIK